MDGIPYNVWLRGLCAGLSWFRLLCFQAETRNLTLWYTTHSICISSNSEGSTKLPDDGRLLPKHVGASIYNKGLVQSVHIVGHFYYYGIRNVLSHVLCSSCCDRPTLQNTMNYLPYSLRLVIWEHSSSGKRTSFWIFSCLLVMSVASHNNIHNRNTMYKNCTYTHGLRSS